MMKKNVLFPSIVVLFFLWAFAHNLNPVLIAKLKSSFSLSDAQATLVDSAFYIAYFLMSLPAGWMIQRWGYKRMIVSGLLLFAAGTLSFVPAALWNEYSFFLGALMCIGFGITILEAAANPLVTEISSPNERSFRLNFAQSFNGLGAGAAAALGGYLLLGKENDGVDVVIMPFAFLGGLVLLFSLFISRQEFPLSNSNESPDDQFNQNIWKSWKFKGAVIAQFFYVGAQIGVASFFIRYAQLYLKMQQQEAAYWLSFGLVLFMLGRFFGTALHKRFSSSSILLIFAIGAIASIAGVLMVHEFSIYYLLATQFFMSVMFPTIFALGVEPLQKNKARGSAWIVMTISGGAIFPYTMGRISDAITLNAAYCVPLISFFVVALFAFYYPKLK
jgi:FHS family L-fucose permease-like MFS transporter